MSAPLEAEFQADYQYTVEGMVIAIVELSQWGQSVANDLDNVLEEIEHQMGELAGYAVVYCDQMGIWDGVRLERGMAKFYELGETAYERVATRLLHLLG